MSAAAPYLELAGRLADASGDVIRRHFRNLPDVSDKVDASPVTIADQQAEEVMRALLEIDCPDHGILGEEGENLRQDADYLWVLDPIDGTKNFASGSHQFGTLISLLMDGAPILGIINQPVLGERWFGLVGETTTFNGQPIKTRACSTLADAWMYSTNPAMFQGSAERAFKSLSGCVKHALFGTDCIGFGLLAAGYTDIICEADMNPWDYMALIPIVEGAGGVISDWHGDPLTLTSDGTVLAAGDPRVHTLAIDALVAV